VRIVYYYRGIAANTVRLNIGNMVTALRQLGHEVTLCFPMTADTSEDDTRPRMAAGRRHRVPRLVWNLAQLWADRRCQRALLQLCREQQPDLIHERHLAFSRGAVKVSRQLGIPLITIAHEFPAHQMPQRFSPLLRWLARRMERASLRGADRLVVVSTPLRDWVVQNLLPPGKVAVIPNGVREELFVNLAAARTRRRSELNLGAHDVALAYLQRWDRNPVHAAAEQLLCELMASLAGLPVRLVSLGGGTQFDEVRARFSVDPRVNGRVCFVGQVPYQEVPGYLAACDIGIIPTHESFTSPMKLFEYMAAGPVVVAPALPNIREIVRDKETGRLFAPGDVTAMGRIVAELVLDPAQRQRLREEARAQVLRKHTWRSNAERFLQLAHEVIDARGR